ncbi:MAG: hypothetical protein IJK02_04725 [Clostridia bacterium]|nr:hypothetical protein [Clostridia bacterium]
MKKTTDELLRELEGFSDFKRFYAANEAELEAVPVADALSAYLDKKGLQKSAVVAASQLSEVYAYQILSGVRQKPARSKLLCITVAMGLEFSETQELLKRTGYPTLYARNPFDCVVIYGILKGMDVIGINTLLYEYLGETLA